MRRTLTLFEVDLFRRPQLFLQELNDILKFGDILGSRLHQGLVRFLDDPTLAARVGAAARVRAAAFDERAYAANVIAALRESLS